MILSSTAIGNSSIVQWTPKIKVEEHLEEANDLDIIFERIRSATQISRTDHVIGDENNQRSRLFETYELIGANSVRARTNIIA